MGDVHAEVNALGLCARRGLSTEGASLYVTMPPCKRCFLTLASAGVRRMVSRNRFLVQEAKDILPVARRLDIDMVSILDTEERRSRLDRLVRGKRDALASEASEPPAKVAKCE